ncbi:hypothetical protein L1O48_10110, partial [Ligilactobacillus equi]|uniref:mucin-binding protein n=1 Tax=Ligilactobacillus equi TaxID=137357 RepID=UPI002ED042F0
VKYVFDNGKKAHDDQSPADITFTGTQDVDSKGQDIGTPKWDKDSETFAGVASPLIPGYHITNVEYPAGMTP